MSTYQPGFVKRIFHGSRRKLAKIWFNMHQPVVIAITGSQGKTNTTHLLRVLLPEALVTDTNLDTIYNVPITSLRLRRKHKLAIYELGIDRKGEMSSHLEIVKPNISIITGIAPVHSDSEHLGSLDNIISEKRKIIEALTPEDFAVLNYDDPNVREMASHTKAKVLFYGSGEQSKDKCLVYSPAQVDTKELSGITLSSKGTSFELFYQGEKQVITSGLIGAHHVSNILAAFTAYQIIQTKYYKTLGRTTAAGVKEILESFAKSVATIKPLPGRMSFETGPKGSYLLNDSLRSNPASVKAGLLTMRHLCNAQEGTLEEFSGKKIAVLGEMGELGELEVEKHREVGKLAAELKLDLLIGIGPLQKETIAAAQAAGMNEKRLFWADTPAQAALILNTVLKKGDLIYLKGSLLRHMERILMQLEGVEVGCQVTSCPLYNHCSKCAYLKSGYPG